MKYLGAYLTCLASIGIPIIKITWSHDHHDYLYDGNLDTWKDQLYIETGPRFLLSEPLPLQLGNYNEHTEIKPSQKLWKNMSNFVVNTLSTYGLAFLGAGTFLNMAMTKPESCIYHWYRTGTGKGNTEVLWDCSRFHQSFRIIFRVDSRFGPCQWEKALLCNNVSHWLGKSLESALTSLGHWKEIRYHDDHRNLGSKHV